MHQRLRELRLLDRRSGDAMIQIDAVDSEKELRTTEIAQRGLSITADGRQRLLVDAAAQLHDVDILHVVQQHGGLQKGGHHIEMRTELAFDRLGESVDRRT